MSVVPEKTLRSSNPTCTLQIWIISEVGLVVNEITHIYRNAKGIKAFILCIHPVGIISSGHHFTLTYFQMKWMSRLMLSPWGFKYLTIVL